MNQFTPPTLEEMLPLVLAFIEPYWPLLVAIGGLFIGFTVAGVFIDSFRRW